MPTLDDLLSAFSGAGNAITNTLADPNKNRAIGQIGGALDPGGLAGKLSTINDLFVRNKAFQEAGAKQSQGGAGNLTSSIKSLFGQAGGLVTPADQDGADSVNITTDANGQPQVTIKATPPTQRPSLTDAPLEAGAAGTPGAATVPPATTTTATSPDQLGKVTRPGDELLPLQTPAELTAADLAGLDVSDVQSLLGNDIQQRQLTQQGLRDFASKMATDRDFAERVRQFNITGEAQGKAGTEKARQFNETLALQGKQLNENIRSNLSTEDFNRLRQVEDTALKQGQLNIDSYIKGQKLDLDQGRLDLDSFKFNVTSALDQAKTGAEVDLLGAQLESVKAKTAETNELLSVKKGLLDAQKNLAIANTGARDAATQKVTKSLPAEIIKLEEEANNLRAKTSLLGVQERVALEKLDSEIALLKKQASPGAEGLGTVPARSKEASGIIAEVSALTADTANLPALLTSANKRLSTVGDNTFFFPSTILDEEQTTFSDLIPGVSDESKSISAVSLPFDPNRGHHFTPDDVQNIANIKFGGNIVQALELIGVK